MLPFYTKAQFVMPNEKDAQEFKKRALIIQLRTPDEDVLKKYRKEPETVERYKTHIGNINESIKQAFSHYWNMHDDILYMRISEIQEFMTKANKEQYAILTMEPGTDVRPEMNTRVLIDGYLFSAYLGGKNKPFFTCMVPDDLLSPFQYEFLLRNIQKYMEAASKGLDRNDKSLWDYDRNMSQLEKNILTLPKSVVSIEESEAREIYKLPLALKSDEEVAELYKQKPEGVLLPGIIFHTHKKIWMYLVINPTTMDVVSLVPVNSGVNFSLRTRKPGYSKYDAYAEAMDLFTIKSSSGFGSKQFMAIAHEMAFKLNY
ncbi:hypothetical protein GCM10009122_24750 [Fulvivirga kasyanovii]